MFELMAEDITRMSINHPFIINFIVEGGFNFEP